MTKREFLKASGAFIASGTLSRLSPRERQPAVRTNWAGNYRYRAARVDAPATVPELQQLVKSRDHFKALGSRHSFDGIADTNGDQISLERFEEMTLDEKSRTVAVGGGVTYSKLALYLDARGYALHNLASLPHVTAAVACSTATHGSNRNPVRAVTCRAVCAWRSQCAKLALVSLYEVCSYSRKRHSHSLCWPGPRCCVVFSSSCTSIPVSSRLA